MNSAKEERIEHLMRELKEAEEKVSYHDGQKFLYMITASEINNQLHELGVKLF